jgi:hypothetical protein
MSQSDYIKYKKTTVELKPPNFSKYPPVLDPVQYTEFSMYNVENQGTNTKSRFSRLIPVGKQDVFGMEKNINSQNVSTTCPIPFLLCKNTNQRANRKLNTMSVPASTYRLNKNPAVATCTFTNQSGFITRTAQCSKTACKCGQTIYKKGFTNKIEKNT